MEKYENDNFIEDQNMDGVDPEYDATYGSDYDPEDDSAFAPENTDEAGYEDGTEYEPGNAGLEDAESEEEEAEPYYDREAFKWLRAENRAKFIKLLAMLILSSAVLIFASIAWFAMNGEVANEGMSVTASGPKFELKSTGSSGLYDNYITRVDSGYSTGTQTSASNSKLILQLTNDSQMDNLWVGSTPPTASDLDRIKRIESTEYGLSPGDHGTLKFKIVPISGATGFNVIIKPTITCYKTEYYTTADTGHTAGYQKDVIAEMSSEIDSERLAIGFTKSHISMYYVEHDEDTDTDIMHLIPDEGFVVENISAEREVVIYWVWPEELEEILEADVAGLDSTASTELRKAFFASPDDYLEKIIESDDFSDIQDSASTTETERSAKAQGILNSPTNYNYYSNRYNSADQTIGDKVGYILLEIEATE